MPTFDAPNTMTRGLGPTWQQTLLHATSAAELAASPKPSTYDVSIFVDDVGCTYQWEPQSVATVDGVRVIGHQTSATDPGRWLLSEPSMPQISVLAYGAHGDGAGDNGAAFDAAAVALAGSGMAMYIPPGNYRFATGFNLRANLTIVSGPNVTLTAALAQAGAFSTANTLILSLGGTLVSTDTLTNDAAVGDGVTTPIRTNLFHAVGTVLGIGSGVGHFQGCSYIVRACSAGPAPFLVTLDRALLIAQPAATTLIQVIAGRPENVKILGNGMTITGVANRLIYIGNPYRCIVDNIDLKPTCTAPTDTFCVTFDTYGVECEGTRLRLVSDLQTLALESCERCYFRYCTVEAATSNSTARAYEITDSAACGVIDCSAFGSHFSVGVDFSGNDPAGCWECFVQGGTYTNHLQAVRNTFGSGNWVDGVTSIKNQNLLQDTDADTTHVPCVARNCVSMDTVGATNQVTSGKSIYVHNLTILSGGVGPLLTAGTTTFLSGYYNGPDLTGTGTVVQTTGYSITEISGFNTAATNYLEAAAQGSLNITAAAGTIVIVRRLIDLNSAAGTQTLVSHSDAGGNNGWFIQDNGTGSWTWAAGQMQFNSTGAGAVAIELAPTPLGGKIGRYSILIYVMGSGAGAAKAYYDGSGQSVAGNTVNLPPAAAGKRLAIGRIAQSAAQGAPDSAFVGLVTSTVSLTVRQVAALVESIYRLGPEVALPLIPSLGNSYLARNFNGNTLADTTGNGPTLTKAGTLTTTKRVVMPATYAE